MSFLNIIRQQELKKRKLKQAQAAYTKYACTGKACACR